MSALAMPQQGSLTNTFANAAGNLAMGALKLATIGLASAVAWQIFLDPIFFPIFHDTTNATAQAFVQMINEIFSWIPEMIGLTGESGFLNTDFMQNMLDPYYDQVAVPEAEIVQHVTEQTGAAFSMDDL